MKQIIEKVELELTKNYERYYRLAYSYVRNEQDALDIVQESAYKAIKGCKNMEQDEYVSTWIYRIVVNEALMLIRSRKNIVQTMPEFEEGKEDQYEDIDLKQAIDKLGDPEHSIVKLRFFEDLPIKEIAKILNLKESTTKTKLYRGLEKLRKYMEEKDYETVVREC